VLDIGAHQGWYGHVLRDAGFRGSIHSFEPLPDAFRVLASATHSDPSWHCHRCAIGSRSGTVEFHVAGNQTSSSLRTMTTTHIAGAPESVGIGRIEVPIQRLDDALPALGIDTQTERIAVKLDVQGAEDMVFEGGQETFQRVRLVEIELSLVELYAGQTLYRDQIQYLAELGFTLIWIERGFQDRATGHLLQIDGIFSRESR